MKISVEISMYPLSETYKPLIKAFIERLKTYKEVVVEVNNMSTQIFGDYSTVFDILKKEIKEEFHKGDKIIYVMKLINTNLQKS